MSESPLLESPVRLRLVLAFLALGSWGAGHDAFPADAAPQHKKSAQERSAGRPTERVEIELRALADTVIAHQTAWIEVRITNNSERTLQVPFRSEKIVGEWRFTDSGGTVVVDWPKEKEMKGLPLLSLGPGEVLYDVLSPESSFGVLTSSATIYAFCRLGTWRSSPVAISRRPASNSEKSALRGLGPLHESRARDKAQVELWSLCGKGNAYFDCDEALFTLIWDRLLVSAAEAEPVVDSLISQSPGSGWCRPALYGIVSRMPEAAGRRYLESLVARKTGGVAEACASELLRRARYGQCPSSNRSGKR